MLMRDGRVEEACPLLEQSQALSARSEELVGLRALVAPANFRKLRILGRSNDEYRAQQDPDGEDQRTTDLPEAWRAHVGSPSLD